MNRKIGKEIEVTEKGRYFMEITDAAEGVEVFVNGRSLGVQAVPSFFFEVTSGLRSGKNLLRVEVATTLERELQSGYNAIFTNHTAFLRTALSGKCLK